MFPGSAPPFFCSLPSAALFPSPLGAKLENVCGVVSSCMAERGTSLTGFELFVVAEFPKSGISSRHILNIWIFLVLWTQILEKVASEM